MDNSIIGEINNLIGDEKSKDIFENRLLYSITGDIFYLKKIVDQSASGIWINSFLEKNKDRNILIYGAGRRGKKIIKLYGDQIKAIVDKNEELCGSKIDGINIFLPIQAVERFDKPIFIVPLRYEFSEVKKNLINLGIPSEDIYDYGKVINEMEKNTYFDLLDYEKINYGAFVDCGAYDGNTSINFINWTNNNYSHIYCFEPDRENYDLCKKNLKIEISEEKVTIINNGTWSCATELFFEENNNGSSKICDKSELSINTVALDDILKGANDISFIKMDIEGAELESLKGAECTIRRCRPMLAVSIYHKPEDIYEIPKYLCSLKLDYIFKFRHYTMQEWDTVLYAIPVNKG